MSEKEVIKVEIPRWLAERLRRYAAERYGVRRGALSRAVVEILERELGGPAEGGGLDRLVGLGLSSDLEWGGEDLGEALRRRHVSN
ncbi:hypothetical protein TUZN_2135 [Thermoproteus uzoniensis 768-20]|uniref:Ribbon-helix-helix protein CopG domain-containing protein n=1 Tax=Thermoproteus uzoniensis (strain 768-20) TaxID=999630 RepID=F2L5P6_THEU7|nr:hypothetical protein [Thermoproteus uzoniensis]AEA13592.1 hypothetical protein TUZN_2135 [Thermoproteus uzoniensis 768-20]